MHRLFILLLLTFWTVMSQGQNLVPNPSFEEYTTCPFGSYQIDKVVSWSSGGGSPDYFNSCSTAGGASVPDNFYGYQLAEDGDGYIGIYTYNRGVLWPDNREVVQAELNTPLTIGQEYFVSFDVSFTLDNNEIGFASNNLGLLFKNVNTYDSDNPPILSNASQARIENVVSDTSSWFHFQGSFVADSAYQRILVGNFFTDTNTNLIEIDSTLYTAYYYVDNICVSEDADDCLFSSNLPVEKSQMRLNVYPNPAHEECVIEWNGTLSKENVKCQILNSTGQIVQSYNFYSGRNRATINVSDLPEGIYVIQVSNLSSNVTRKLIIN